MSQNSSHSCATCGQPGHNRRTCGCTKSSPPVSCMCSNCGIFGHSKRKCPEPIKPVEPKQPKTKKPIKITTCKCSNCGEIGHSKRKCTREQMEWMELPQDLNRLFKTKKPVKNTTCKCSNCGVTGHSKRKCTEPVKAKPVKTKKPAKAIKATDIDKDIWGRGRIFGKMFK